MTLRISIALPSLSLKVVAEQYLASHTVGCPIWAVCSLILSLSTASFHTEKSSLRWNVKKNGQLLFFFASRDFLWNIYVWTYVSFGIWIPFGHGQWFLVSRLRHCLVHSPSPNANCQQTKSATASPSRTWILHFLYFFKSCSWSVETASSFSTRFKHHTDANTH